MKTVRKIFSRQIIDSRGNPTLEVDVFLNDGSMGRSAVPSGASTGKFEAIELRDNQKSYLGKSVQKAIYNINNIIAPKVIGMNVNDIKSIDSIMIKLDGTENKGQLGANAILGVSMATIHAASNCANMPLFKYLNKESSLLPSPMMNILNGGSHADNNIDIQEFMIFPVGASSFSSALQMGVEIFHHLKLVLKKQGLSTNVGDEGGFAPNLKSNSEAIELILQAIENASYKIEADVCIALDVAASELYNSENNTYNILSEKKSMSSDQLIEYYANLCKQYPIISIEDGLDENDWSGWQNLNLRLGNKIQIVGDDLTVTNPRRLEKAIKEQCINAILIKLNQIGSVSETIEAINIAKSAGIASIISHRSGETGDTTIADFSVSMGSGQIKTGSLCRTDRVAKYNQLLRIEEELGGAAEYAGKNFLGYITKGE